MYNQTRENIGIVLSFFLPFYTNLHLSTAKMECEKQMSEIYKIIINLMFNRRPQRGQPSKDFKP